MTEKETKLQIQEKWKRTIEFRNKKYTTERDVHAFVYREEKIKNEFGRIPSNHYEMLFLTVDSVRAYESSDWMSEENDGEQIHLWY